MACSIPAGGVEFNLAFFGIRLEAGDEIYFDNGAIIT